MHDANELVKRLKQAAIDAMESTKPVSVFFGEVVDINPLRINVEQKMILGENQLILSRNVTDFSTEVSIAWATQSSLSSHSHMVKGKDSNNDTVELTSGNTNLAHNHDVSGKKKITIHNGLVVGDTVLLIRQQEGQKYMVWDRIG